MLEKITHLNYPIKWHLNQNSPNIKSALMVH